MKKITKAIAAFVGIAAFSVVAVSSASAATSAELQAQITALMAQLQSATGGSVSMPAATFTRDLTIGSSGADVTALQNWLMSKGYGIPAGATGYFGAQTQAAVKMYQMAKNLPSTGYFGPLTRGAIAAETAVVVTTPPVTGGTGTGTGTGTDTGSSSDLEGDDGEISDISKLSQYNNEDVGEGEEDVKVMGFEVEASNDGDIRLRSLKLVFDPTGNGHSDHLDDYVSSVKVWMGDEEVGSADVDDFNEEDDDTFSKTISLNNVVIRADETEKFYVTVDASGSFDSSDIADDSWTVGLESVRFEDGSGVVTTDDSSFSTGAGAIGWDSTNDGVGLDFVSFSTAADTELKVSKNSDSPEGGVVMVDDNDDTDDVTLLKGKLRLDGESDVNLDELPVTFTVANGANYLSFVTGAVTLKLGDDEFSETVASSTGVSDVVNFDDLDFDIEAGDTVDFEVTADINDIDSPHFPEGATLKAEITSTNRDNMDVENEEGDQLDDSSEKSGTALGETQEFRTEGIQVTLVGSPSADSNENDAADTGTFTIKYKVKALGDTVYIASLAANAVTVAVYDSQGVATSAATIKTTIKNETDTTKTQVGNYEIEEDEEETFTVTITVPNGVGDASDQYYAAITGIKWDTTDDTTPSNTYNQDLDDFQTPTVYLDNA